MEREKLEKLLEHWEERAEYLYEIDALGERRALLRAIEDLQELLDG